MAIFAKKNDRYGRDHSFRREESAFKKLLEVAELTALTKEDRALYEEKVKVYRDYLNQLDYAVNEGWEKGREEGVLLMASAMKNQGITTSVITDCTGLSIEHIEKL